MADTADDTRNAHNMMKLRLQQVSIIGLELVLDTIVPSSVHSPALNLQRLTRNSVSDIIRDRQLIENDAVDSIYGGF